MGVRKALKSTLQGAYHLARGKRKAEASTGVRQDGRWVHHPLVRPRIARVIEAAADCMFPPGGAIPYSAKDVDLTAYMLDFLGKAPVDKSNMLCILMLGYEYGFPAMLGKGLRFTSMSTEQQTAMLKTMHDSPLYPFRILNFCFRMFLTFGYMADERVLKEMGYFKLHDYPSDHRVIEILKSLPWELRNQAPAGEVADPDGMVETTSTEETKSSSLSTSALEA